MNYKIITDTRVIEFYKKCTDKKFKRTTGIKFPWFGKNRGTMLVPEGTWGNVSNAYIACGGKLLPKGEVISIRYLTKPK